MVQTGSFGGLYIFPHVYLFINLPFFGYIGRIYEH